MNTKDEISVMVQLRHGPPRATASYVEALPDWVLEVWHGWYYGSPPWPRPPRYDHIRAKVSQWLQHRHHPSISDHRCDHLLTEWLIEHYSRIDE